MLTEPAALPHLCTVFDRQDIIRANERGNAYLQAGQPERAVPDYQRALQLGPPYPEVWINLGQVLNLLGRHEEAAAAYGQALDLDPKLLRYETGRLEDYWRTSPTPWRWHPTIPTCITTGASPGRPRPSGARHRGLLALPGAAPRRGGPRRGGSANRRSLTGRIEALARRRRGSAGVLREELCQRFGWTLSLASDSSLGTRAQIELGESVVTARPAEDRSPGGRAPT